MWEATIPKVRFYRRLQYLSAAICLTGCCFQLVGCSAPQEEEGVNSLYFGGDCYVEIVNNTSLRSMVEGDFSIELWVAADQSVATTLRTIIMAGNNRGGNEIGIYQAAYDSSAILVYIADQLMGEYKINNLNWRQGKFHYICLTKEGVVVSFYFDGLLVGSQTMIGVGLNLGSSNILIGADYDPPGVNANVGNFWKGWVDEVRLWSRCIKADEVQYKAHHPEKLLQYYSVDDLARLSGLWRFNAIQELILSDESGKGIVANLCGDLDNFSWSRKKSGGM